MLTEIERHAIDKMRGMLSKNKDGFVAFGKSQNDFADAACVTLSVAMLRLYPPSHDAAITPERLVECGGRSACEHQDEIHFGSQLDRYVVFDYSVKGDFMWFVNHRSVHPIVTPRNMGEVWQLLERCGIPVRKVCET